ncbi:TPA: deoxyuridine 5'-triphosphate nucleotidohydrolase [Clostridioides difficile]|uniref:dUTP diphosphatase n=1 Tax=Clostridioides difficile TaxID=1496 RepID=A0AAN5VN17_CLODI|nr:deoxyuridine 5'-triphosphate nucleotidohydrolase [Clostridioides difficile]EGT3829125.1 deoxyuridine 5'-triphosphate nucleotidohydrolase [Clostridioides difficile]EIS9475099.1 deoxyuridine 5'-triphosphate nucleotidohydrolase [Clostridioides difficile]EIS9655001.1 deoxyuridine 5'-triphosphate nucleotidohydrolase [Clostridioides difficile]EJX2691303.1 deoxyuridine 5'-triphosphate nucleotidohydrolase [Clostridioides difficile]EJX3390062.1 deoxyuridine 5'-triphosphate nucleotidohydrolase [Clost
MSINVKIKKLSQDAIVPSYAKEGDSGIDLYTLEDTVIPAKSAVAISTGIALEIPYGYEMQVRPRSGISLKGILFTRDVTVCDKEQLKKQIRKSFVVHPTVRLGTVDSGYRGEIKIITYNEENFEILIPKHIKLAQGVFQQVPRAILKVVDELSNSERGNSGFGSTGIK